MAAGGGEDAIGRGGRRDRGDQRRRERSPRLERGSRERERYDHDFDRGGLERGDNGRRDRISGLKVERERGGDEFAGGGWERGAERKRGRSPDYQRGDSRERGRRQDDFGRGDPAGGENRRERYPYLTPGGNRERDQGEDKFARGGLERRDAKTLEGTPGSIRPSRERGRGVRDVSSDVSSPQGGISKRSSSPSQVSLDCSEEKDGRDEDKRQSTHSSIREKVREMSSRGRRKPKSRDKDSDTGDSEEDRELKVKGMREAATKARRYATSVVDDVDNKNELSRRARKLERESSSSAGESEEDDEETDDSKPRKRKVRKREKYGKHSERGGKKRKHRRERTESTEDNTSESDGASSSGSEVSDSEDEVQREKARKQRKRRRQKEKERELEREKKRRAKRKMKELKEKKLKVELKKIKKKEMRSKKPITTSWGKYGILKDIDMWNKKPEFSAWLAEVKKVNTETLPNWEEKLMFKEYMEDYNTATFPSKRYYNLDIYHRRKAAKERLKGMAKMVKVERTDFNDEDERRLELRKEREVQKQADVEALMRKMQGGMAQDMKEQAQLREEMQYQFRLGNTEAAQAIQRRLDPDAEKFTK